MVDLLEPVAAIREHMAGFEQAVDRENFGTRDPEVIASMVNDFCTEQLASGVDGYLFCTASQGQADLINISLEALLIENRNHVGDPSG